MTESGPRSHLGSRSDLENMQLMPVIVAWLQDVVRGIPPESEEVYLLLLPVLPQKQKKNKT